MQNHAPLLRFKEKILNLSLLSNVKTVYRIVTKPLPSKYQCENTEGSFKCQKKNGVGSFKNKCEEFSITSTPTVNPYDDLNEISGIYQLVKGIVQILKINISFSMH